MLPLLLLATLSLYGADPSGPKLESDGWRLNAAIECGNAANLSRAGTDHFALAPREDPVPVDVQKTGPISNYVIHIEITNLQSAARTITVDVMIPEWLIREKFDYFLRKPYLVRTPERLDYQLVPADRQTSLPDRVRIKIDFAARERKILATTAAYPYSVMRKRLREIAANSRGKARVGEIGRSVEGRPVLSLETGNSARPRAIFMATLQPGEPSAWAILSMADAVTSKPELARLLEEYDLAFLPMTNPDGVVHGSNNVNGKGEIVLVGFTHAIENKPGMHEAKVLWNYISRKPPEILIDFHFLNLPNHPLPRPYVFDLTLYTDAARRSRTEDMLRRLESLSSAPKGPPIRRDHPLWQHLATFHSIGKWNTIATLYQNTGPKTSHQQAEVRGVELMRVALDPKFSR